MEDTTKIKIIELLNKIANKESVPKRIKYGIHEYEWVFGAIDNKWCYARRVTGSCVIPFDKVFNLGDWEILNDTVTILEWDKPLEELKYLNCTDIDINNACGVDNITKECIISDIQTLQTWVNKIIKEINKE